MTRALLKLSVMYSLMWLLPKNQISFVFGCLTRLRLGKLISGAVNRSYARLMGVNLAESARPPEDYPSLAEFFVRDLKPGLRPIEGGVLSPADGQLVIASPISDGSMIQAKGRHFNVEQLLAGYSDWKSFKNGYYVTVYLSPKDYHHIHSPVDGNISASGYVPGQLWPVNAWSVNRVKNLFCINERVISIINSKEGSVAVVKVGATMVGSISVVYDDFRSNENFIRGTGAQSPVWRTYSNEPRIARGDRLGTFHLGSTVILVFPNDTFQPGAGCVPGAIQYGRSLGSMGKRT